ncbi:helix-turn-helix domain-containing protein [Geobacter sp.]|uniref:helix-turn-helix domain-containing protein n=1 Tax=Geobacter sp. TaxID=46610 RepID=UPI002629C3AF|nr:helix-turn-helix domain-containing protein [Geobacter sp.]
MTDSLQMSTANADAVEKIYSVLKLRYKLDSDKALADFLGVDYRTLAAWKSRGKIAKIDAFVDKCSGINVDWLKTGKGEPFKEEGKGEAAEGQPYRHPDPKIQKIVEMLEAMNDSAKEDILRDVEKEKLLMELMKERQEKKAG